MDRSELSEIVTCLVERQERERQEMLAEYSASMPGLGGLFERSGGKPFDALYADRKIELVADRLVGGWADGCMLLHNDFNDVVANFAAAIAAPAGTEEQRQVTDAMWRLDGRAAVAVRLLDEWSRHEWLLRLAGIELVSILRGASTVEVAKSDQRMIEVVRSAFSYELYRENAERRNAAATDLDRQIEEIFLPLYRASMGLSKTGESGGMPPDDFVRRSFKDELGPATEVQRQVRAARLKREMNILWPPPMTF